MPQILIIEDEPSIASVLKRCLESEGYACDVAEDGETGIQKFWDSSPDAVILDLMLPKKNGLDVCREIRGSNLYRRQETPIMMLSSRVHEVDRILGYSSGADDYMHKPFSPKELLVRLQAMVRRNSRYQSDSMLEFENIAIDVESREVTVVQEGTLQMVALSAREFDLLVLFASQPDWVWSRDQLIDRLRSADADCTDRAVDTWIRRLRSKLSSDRERFIKTHPRVGYSFGAKRKR